MNTKVIFHTAHGLSFFNANEIVRLQSISNYTWVYFISHKPLLLAKVLKEFEPVLLPLGFLRIHRSHLVNKNNIVKIEGNKSVVMSDESVATIARRKRNMVISEIVNTTMY